MENKFQEIEQILKSIPNYHTDFATLKEVGFIAKGTNSFGIFEYADLTQNLSYIVKVFIFNTKENLDQIYQYLKNLHLESLELDCILKYLGFYFNISDKQNSIKINVVFEKYTDDLVILLMEEQLSYNQIKQIIEDLIFSCCELIGFGYILQDHLSLTQIKYIKQNNNDYQIKFIQPYLIENIEDNQKIQEFLSNSQLNSYTEIGKCEVLILGVLILQLLGNYTKVMDNAKETPIQLLQQINKDESLDSICLSISKNLEKQNIPIQETTELLKIIKKMINKDQRKISLPIQIYFQWLNFNNQQEFFSTGSQKQNKCQKNLIKSVSNQNLQDSQSMMSDEQLQKIQSEDIVKESDNGDDLVMQEMVKEDLQGFNYPSLEEIQQNKQFLFQNGSIYEGEWLNQKCHGQGTLITAKGSRYIGNWIENKFTGKGMIIYYTGFIHEGQFKEGLAQGYGILKHSINGYVYEGNFENNQKHGYNNFSDNKLIRFGVQKLTTGTVFTGIFDKNQKIFGHYDYYTGNKYTGQIKNSKMTGFGRYLWTDGRIYHGNFTENLKDGPGIFNAIDGRVYQGCFQKNKYHGFGIMSHPNNIEYGGAWLVFDFSQQNNRVHNKLNGYGFYANKGKAQLVEWKNSKIVKKYGTK